MTKEDAFAPSFERVLIQSCRSGGCSNTVDAQNHTGRTSARR